jgi:RAB protein geranylgeranyltransferase component A
LLSSLQKTTQKSVSTEAGIFFLGSFIISKSAGKRKQTVDTGAKRKAEGKVSSRREAPQRCSHLQKQVRPLFTSLYSLKLFKLVLVTRTVRR